MATPRKRKNSRSENRAKRYTPPSTPAPASTGTIPRPPSTCQPFHFYWCDGHNDWHHHDEFVVTAIERTLAQPAPQQDAIQDAMDKFDE